MVKVTRVKKQFQGPKEVFDEILCIMNDIYFHDKIKQYDFIPCKVELQEIDYYKDETAIAIFDQITGSRLL